VHLLHKLHVYVRINDEFCTITVTGERHDKTCKSVVPNGNEAQYAAVLTEQILVVAQNDLH